MKIAITGHTKGLGAQFYETLEEADHAVFGFSSSLGFDIAHERTIEEIIHLDPDVLINNAWTVEDPWAQYRLQAEFTNRLSDKRIISVGTRATDWGIGGRAPIYEGAKEAVHRHARWINLHTDHRSLLVRPGLLAIEKFKHRDKPKISPKYIAGFVQKWLTDGTLAFISEVVWTPEIKSEDVTNVLTDSIH